MKYERFAGAATVLLAAVLIATASCSVDTDETTHSVEGASGSAEISQATDEAGDDIARSSSATSAIPELPVVDTPCVDAVGPNSTPDDIVHAALDTPSMPGPDGLFPEIEYASRIPDGVDPYEFYAPRYYTGEVPEGGDAAYAEVACDLWVHLWDMNLDDNEITEILTRPGFVRSDGRKLCTSLHADGDPAEFIEDAEQQTAELAGEAAGLAASSLSQAEEELSEARAEIDLPTPEDMDPADTAVVRARAVESASRFVDWARRQTDITIQYGQIAQLKTMRAALEFVCPTAA